MKPFILGVCGGSGSGKTYFANDLKRLLGEENCLVVYQDSFYFDQSAKFDRDGGSVNYDHPSAIEFSYLSECLSELKKGKKVHIPVYNFATHKRELPFVEVSPKPIVIVDGILILQSQEVRQQLDEAIFFATDESLRYERRLARDVSERGRTPSGVKAQFEAQVKPMHDLFVEPSKKYANWTINDVGDYDRLLKEVMAVLVPTLPPELQKELNCN